jgi:hypothetical protein
MLVDNFIEMGIGHSLHNRFSKYTAVYMRETRCAAVGLTESQILLGLELKRCVDILQTVRLLLTAESENGLQCVWK